MGGRSRPAVDFVACSALGSAKRAGAETETETATATAGPVGREVSP